MGTSAVNMFLFGYLGLKKTSDAISKRLILKHFLEEHASRPPLQLLCGCSHVPSQSQVSFTAYEPVFNLVLLGWSDSIAKSKLEWISQDR